MGSHSLEVGTLIRAAEHLAPLPSSASRLSVLVREQGPDLEEITQTVRLDLALAGQVIGAANARNSGGEDSIDTVEQAIVQLGNATILEIVQRGLEGPETERSKASETEAKLWKHSILCALATEGFEHFAKTRVMSETFATALLHDLGSLVLERKPQSEGTPSLAHANLGARVARHWGIPARICNGIEHHHTPLLAQDGPTRRLCSQVLLGDAVAAEVGGACSSGDPVAFSPALAGSMGISRKGFDGLCEHTSRRYQSVIDSYAA